MEKYNFGFKKQIVEEYLNKQGGFDFLAKRYGFYFNLNRHWLV